MKIVLLGYMASGKSSIGKLLSKSLNINFIDLDDYIIEKENKSISSIFKEKGEIYFRRVEHQYLKEIIKNHSNFILSLGGGTPCYAYNMESIKEKNINSFYLQANIPTLVSRLIKEKSDRPLIASLDDEQIPEFIAKHLFERRFFYEQAKHILKIDNKSKEAITTEIKQLLD